MATIITLGISLFCWGLFAVFFMKDRSRYRNCYLLFNAILSLIPFIVNASGEYDFPVILILFYTILIALLITPFFLIFNGIVMLRKEGRQLPHLLSLFLGIIILAGEIATAYSMLMGGLLSEKELQGSTEYLVWSLFRVTVIYGSMSVLIFVIYMLLLQIIPWKKNFDYVIILGAGLIDGDKMTKLLSDRIDKAIEVYKRCAVRPKLIPSGGQGSDETIPEAEAMKRYLLEKGIPEADIITEDKSATTFENLTNSKKIIEERGGSKNVALVSSNYHVYRALRYCRKIGFKCTGIGGHVAFYFWPSALIREYIAVHAEKKHAVMFVLGWLINMALAVYVIRFM